MNRTTFPLQKEMLRAVTVTGGASDMDSIWQAANDTLPFVKNWRFKTLHDPAFVPSLGAAAEIRRELIRIGQRECYCEVPVPWKDGPLWNDTWRLEYGMAMQQTWVKWRLLSYDHWSMLYVLIQKAVTKS